MWMTELAMNTSTAESAIGISRASTETIGSSGRRYYTLGATEGAERSDHVDVGYEMNTRTMSSASDEK